MRKKTLELAKEIYNPFHSAAINSGDRLLSCKLNVTNKENM